jgi:hypothetical protein
MTLTSSRRVLGAASLLALPALLARARAAAAQAAPAAAAPPSIASAWAR